MRQLNEKEVALVKGGCGGYRRPRDCNPDPCPPPTPTPTPTTTAT